MNNAQSFGRKVARTQDRLYDEARIAKKAESLLFDASNSMFKIRTEPKTLKWKIAVAAAAALVMVSTAFIVYRSSPSSSLTVTVNGIPTDPNERHWVHAPKEKETVIDFSDGSRISLKKDGRTRFIEITPQGADLLVEQGRLVADIAHLEKTRWRFFAGPFEVRVTGTRFSLDWDQQHELFSVTMEKGSVEISGPLLAETRALRAGETFIASVNEDRTEIVTHPRNRNEKQSDVTPPVEPAGRPTREIHGNQMIVVGASTKTDGSAPPATQSLTLQPTKKHRDICDGLDPTDHLEQADASRLSGKVTQAAKQYAKIRRCFPESSSAVLSAFNLGKIAFDSQRDWDDAARWFNKYLQEQRGEGPVREAMGRLMEAYVNGQQPQKARAIAHRYLARYPDGPHAVYATSLIEEEID
jgi:transmembrane sensor